MDIVDVARFEESLQRTPGLRDRLFTPNERELPVPSLAARFAAKEAIAKALGAPNGLAWQDAEVRSADDGRPTVHVDGTVAAAAERCGARHLHLSLSHDAGLAVAMVVAED